MLEPQKSELPHETEYFLDGAVENMDMDHGSRMALIVFGDRSRIEAIVEGRERFNPGPLGDTKGDRAETAARFNRFKATRLAKCDQLTAYADEILAQCGPVYQLGAHLIAINGILTAVRGHAEHYADCAMIDSLEGGNMASYDRRKRPWREHEKRDKQPTKRISRRLHAPTFIKRYVEGRKESDHLRRLWHTLVRRGVPKYNESQLDEALSVFDAAYEQHRERVQIGQQRAYDAFVAEIKAEDGIKRKATKKPPYRILKQKRKATKRAALFAAGLLGASAVSAFAAGKPVFVDGADMTFEIKKRGSLHRVGHSAIELALLDKSRAKLADLRFFIEGTPSLDQLTGIALAVRAGEERDILDTANVIKVEAAGVGHSLLGERSLPSTVDRLPNAAMINGIVVPFHDRLATRRARNEAYWQETKDVWIQALGIHIFNRKWKSIKGMIANS